VPDARGWRIKRHWIHRKAKVAKRREGVGVEVTANLANLANPEEMQTGDDEGFHSSSKDSQDSPDSRCLSLFAINHPLSAIDLFHSKCVGPGLAPRFEKIIVHP
jgi:hypothetical protein